VFLAHCVMPKVMDIEQISGRDELLQMSVIEVIRLDCKNDSAHWVSDVYMCICIVCLTCRLGSVYPAHFRAFGRLIAREAATTLATLTQDQTAVKGGFLVAYGSVVPDLHHSVQLPHPVS